MPKPREEPIGDSLIRLVETKSGYAGIVIRDETIVFRTDGDDADIVWRELKAEVARTNPSFFGFDGARARFLRIFGDGFKSEAYSASERTYKCAAKAKLESVAPLSKALTDAGLGEAVLSVFRATNLLSPFEGTRMQAALRGPEADRFIRGAAVFATGEIERGLSEMKQALKPHHVAKWTSVTYLPFLWRPEVHMFLKPEVTKDFAERVGHGFVHEYETDLRAPVYESLLSLAATTEKAIEDLEPRDRIDIQSFIWVVGKYDSTNDGEASHS